MKRYETFVIVDPDVSEDARNQLIDRFKQLIADQNGTLVVADEWGSRKLAYEIKKKVRGYYIRLDFCGTGALVDEMERQFRIDDRVIKYMTVLLSDAVDMAAIQEEIEQLESKATRAAKPEKPAGDAPPAAAEPEKAAGDEPAAIAEPETPAGDEPPPADEGSPSEPETPEQPKTITEESE